MVRRNVEIVHLSIYVLSNLQTNRALALFHYIKHVTVYVILLKIYLFQIKLTSVSYTYVV